MPEMPGQATGEGPAVEAVDVIAIEQELCRLPDVSAARIVAGPEGRPVEIHVLALPTKAPKQIVRDIVGKRLTDQQVERASISILAQCVYYRYGRLMLQAIFPDRPTTPETITSIAEDIYRFSIAALDALKRD